jgi:hypothetical protein
MGVSIQPNAALRPMSQIETVTIRAHPYKNSDAVAFLLHVKNPNWPIEKIDESHDDLLSS